MGAYFFDTSALVKYYVQETGTLWVQGVINNYSANEITIALVTGVEIVAAITRQNRMNAISAVDAATAIATFKNQFRNRLIAFRITDQVVDDAMALAEKYGLRGYDAIQLTSALFIESRITSRGVGPLTFVCSDKNLNQAATIEGLLVEDPNQYP